MLSRLSRLERTNGEPRFSLGWLRRWAFGISINEVTFTRRRFHESNPTARLRLEKIGRKFLQGYHLALESDRPEVLVKQLNAIELEFTGFAYEGAAMGLALFDLLSPRRNDRLQSFLCDFGAAHAYMVHVGIGWALARIPWRMKRTFYELDPLLRWLVIDGYGFHEGYFHWEKYVKRLAPPKRISGYACRVFDQGLGRSLWFIEGADTTRIPATIGAFPIDRRADLWSGIGLACAYAGGVDDCELKSLGRAAGQWRSHLAQGVAFAAKARQRAGNPALHTEHACEILCDKSATAAAELTDIALQKIQPGGAMPEYEVWRQCIEAEFCQLN